MSLNSSQLQTADICNRTFGPGRLGAVSCSIHALVRQNLITFDPEAKAQHVARRSRGSRFFNGLAIKTGQACFKHAAEPVVVRTNGRKRFHSSSKHSTNGEGSLEPPIVSTAHQFGTLRTINPAGTTSGTPRCQRRTQADSALKENSLLARTPAEDGSSVVTAGQLSRYEESESASPEDKQGKCREHRVDGARSWRARCIDQWAVAAFEWCDQDGDLATASVSSSR